MEPTKANASGSSRAYRGFGCSVQSQPDHEAFKAVKVTLWAEEVSAEAIQIFKRRQEERPALKNADLYEDWGDMLSLGDWLIDFDLSGDRPKFTGYWNVIDTHRGLNFVDKAGTIDLPGLGRLTLDATSKAALKAAAGALLEKHASRGETAAAVPLDDALRAAFAPNDRRARQAAG